MSHQLSEMASERTHYHGDGCPGGHYYRNRYGGNRERCVHDRWTCNHCHDDPPAGHTCPDCGVKG